MKRKNTITLRIASNTILILLCVLLSGYSVSAQNKKKNIPKLKLISITPNPAVAFEDEIKFTLSYEDYDGDLGENKAGVKNLFLRDSRNKVIYKYRIRKLASLEDIRIRGELNIILNSAPFINESNGKEEVIYSIWVKDRAGNCSDTLETPTLKLIAD